MPVMMNNRHILTSWPGKGGLSMQRPHKPLESDGNNMLTRDERKALLPGAGADFLSTGQDAPLLSTSDSEKYDELDKATPTFIGGK